MSSSCGCHKCDSASVSSPVEHGKSKYFNKETGMLLAALIFFVAGIFQKGTGAYICFALSYIISGWKVVINAVKSLIKGGIFDENFLMTVASIGAVCIGEYLEAAAVMVFYNIGEYFSDMSVDNSRNEIKKLMNIRPDAAYISRDGEIIEIEPSLLKVGDEIIIRAGDRIPVDCKILSGSGYIDNSALTGESKPAYVSEGDSLLSGGINKDALITAKVTAHFSDSTATRILKLAEESSEKKAATEKFITKFSKIYTPVVVCLALLIAVVPLPFGGDAKTWIYRALTFLLVSCPCALVLSIPLGFFASIGGASKQGILFKGGIGIEALSKIKAVVFDKTGTLTKGAFSVSKIYAENGDSDEFLALAAAAEEGSTHPIGIAIVSAASGKTYEKAENLIAVAGMGIKADYKGKTLLVGNKKLLEGINIKESSESAVYVAYDQKFMGYIEVEDEIKENAKRTIETLKKSGIAKITMLTGDKKEIGEKVASEIGIENPYCELLPEGKVEAIRKIEKDFGNAAFVGDGINDAPVLATASCGISMGGIGSDAAIEASDVVLMNDDIENIPTAVSHAKRTMKIETENIVGSIGVKVLVLVASVIGIAQMWHAIVADVVVCLVAVLNAMRLLKIKYK